MKVRPDCVNTPLQNQGAPSLQNVSLNVGSKQLVAVIGPVGAGKVRGHPSIQTFGKYHALEILNLSFLP